MGANLHEKVSSALETVRPSQKLFIRAISRFAQLRKVLIWWMTSEGRKCPKWRFWMRHFACFLVFLRFDNVSNRFSYSFQEMKCAYRWGPHMVEVKSLHTPGFSRNQEKTEFFGISTKNVIKVFFLKIHKKFKSS